MGRRKSIDVSAEQPRTVRVRKRKPRDGVKRAMNLVMTDANCTRLEALAVIEKTTPAEVVQDMIEQRSKGLRLSVPGKATVGDDVAA